MNYKSVKNNLWLGLLSLIASSIGSIWFPMYIKNKNRLAEKFDKDHTDDDNEIQDQNNTIEYTRTTYNFSKVECNYSDTTDSYEIKFKNRELFMYKIYEKTTTITTKTENKIIDGKEREITSTTTSFKDNDITGDWKQDSELIKIYRDLGRNISIEKISNDEYKEKNTIYETYPVNLKNNKKTFKEIYVKYIPSTDFNYFIFNNHEIYGLSKKYYYSSTTKQQIIDMIKVSKGWITFWSIVIILLPAIGTGFWTAIFENLYSLSNGLTTNGATSNANGLLGVVGNWVALPFNLVGSGIQIGLGFADFAEDIIRYIIGITVGLTMLSPMMTIFVSIKWLFGCVFAVLGWVSIVSAIRLIYKVSSAK